MNATPSPPTTPSILPDRPRMVIVGGSGFLGRHLYQSAPSAFSASIFDARPPEFPATDYTIGSILDLNQLVAVFRGVDVVVHSASLIQHADPEFIHAVNVAGTRNVIQACLEARVRCLIYTGTVNVTMERYGPGSLDESELDAYSTCPLNEYARTKAEAEQLVLSANSERLYTCVIRPGALMGPGDPLAVPKLSLHAESYRNCVKIGNGDVLVDYVAVETVTDVHWLVLNGLSRSDVNGQAFIVTNGEPIHAWDLNRIVWARLGKPAMEPSVLVIPTPLAKLAAHLIVVGTKIWNQSTGSNVEPLVTPQQVDMLTRHWYYRNDKVERVFGYRARVSLETSINAAVDWFLEQQKLKQMCK